MNQQFLKEIEMGSKNALVKKRIITHYIYNGSSTIPQSSKELNLSVPQSPSLSVKCVRTDISMITENWKPAVDATRISMD